VDHRRERGDGENVAGDFDGAFFRRALDFLNALGMGHGADVPDVLENFARIGQEQRRQFAIVRPGANNGAFVGEAGFGIEEKRN
jgi:hypothetical protein